MIERKKDTKPLFRDHKEIEVAVDYMKESGKLQFKSSYSMVVLWESWRLRVSDPKNLIPISSYLITSRQYWLGIAKLKNVFKLTINPSTKLL